MWNYSRLDMPVLWIESIDFKFTAKNKRKNCYRFKINTGLRLWQLLVGGATGGHCYFSFWSGRTPVEQINRQLEPGISPRSKPKLWNMSLNYIILLSQRPSRQQHTRNTTRAFAILHWTYKIFDVIKVPGVIIANCGSHIVITGDLKTDLYKTLMPDRF